MHSNSLAGAPILLQADHYKTCSCSALLANQQAGRPIVYMNPKGRTEILNEQFYCLGQQFLPILGITLSVMVKQLLHIL